jgi:hypothetical protein
MVIHAAFSLDAAVVMLVKDSPLYMLCEVTKGKRVRSSEMTFTPAPQLHSLVSPLPMSTVGETTIDVCFSTPHYRNDPHSSFIPASPAAVRSESGQGLEHCPRWALPEVWTSSFTSWLLLRLVSRSMI